MPAPPFAFMSVVLTGLRAAERSARPSEAENVRGTIEVVVENVEDVAAHSGNFGLLTA